MHALKGKYLQLYIGYLNFFTHFVHLTREIQGSCITYSSEENSGRRRMTVHIVWLCLLWLKSRLHLTSESVLLPFRTSASLITCGPKVNKTSPKTSYQFISIMTTIQKIKLLISYLVKEISRMIWFHNKINTLCRHFPPSIYLIYTLPRRHCIIYATSVKICISHQI